MIPHTHQKLNSKHLDRILRSVGLTRKEVNKVFAACEIKENKGVMFIKPDWSLEGKDVSDDR